LDSEDWDSLIDIASSRLAKFRQPELAIRWLTKLTQSGFPIVY